MPLGLKLALGAQGIALAWSLHRKATVPASVAGLTVVAMLVAWREEVKRGAVPGPQALKGLRVI